MKSCAHFLGPELRIAQPPEETGRRVRVIAASGGQDRAGQLVLRHVRADRAADPLVVLDRADLADEPLIDAEPVRPLERPPVGELGKFQEHIDQLGSLLRVGVGEEGANLGRAWEPADGVEIGTANELLIG